MVVLSGVNISYSFSLRKYCLGLSSNVPISAIDESTHNGDHLDLDIKPLFTFAYPSLKIESTFV